MTDTESDRRFMAAAIRLARLHEGRTGSNPSVATILVRETENGPVIVGSAVTAIGDYRKIHSAAEIVIQRAATGLGQAVWFGALTGGFEGVILEFNENRLMIGPTIT